MHRVPWTVVPESRGEVPAGTCAEHMTLHITGDEVSRLTSAAEKIIVIARGDSDTLVAGSVASNSRALCNVEGCPKESQVSQFCSF